MKHQEVIPMPHLLSNNLIKLRKKKSLTQKEVASRIDIKVRTYQAYEERRCEPSMMILFKLKVLYSLDSVEQLFY